MVVNRKQPVAPAPLVQSRSNSQQPITTRKKQAKHTNINGINSYKPEHVPATNPDQKSKSTSKPRPRKKSLRDKLFFWSLSLFAFYSFLVCSSYTTTPQKSQSHLICRAESIYKAYVIDPFILPPLKYTFSITHSLAKPYISQANTHLEPYLAPVKQVTSTVKPYVMHTVTTTKRVWERTLTPFYKNNLKPYYQSAILPRYNLYLRPYLPPLVTHLERYYAYYVSNPIRIQYNRVQLHFFTLYATHIHSYILHLQPYIHRFTSTIHTAWLSSLHFYGTHIQPTLLSAWIQAQPHLSFAFDQAKDISLSVVARTAKHLKGLANQVGTQRRTYVDPHIRKIWDKVEENTTAKSTTAPVDILPAEETAESTILAPLVMDEAATPITNTKEPDALPIDVPVPEEDAQTVLYSAGSTPSLAPSSLSPPQAASTQEAQSAVSIAEASAHGASTVLYELEREAENLVGGNAADAMTSATVENSKPESKQTKVVQAKAEVKPETPNEPVTSVTKQSPEVISTKSFAEASLGDASPSPTTGRVMGAGASSPPSHSIAEDDLADFLRDIGVDTSASSSSSPSPSPTPTQLSEADQAAAVAAAQEAESSRLAFIASKRLAIITRHATFESNLQSAILTSTSQTVDKLTEMREAKKEELIHMIEGEGLVAELTLSGDKLMKGLEVYLKKCQERSGTWKSGVDNKGEDEEDIQKRTEMAKDEQTRLESVIEKVEIKFLDVVNKLQEQVNGWYLSIIEKEQEEMSNIANEIQNMAEQAQASIGMDYAWLEDVTYMDWQRYHDLLRVAEKFQQTVNAIQDGSSVDPLSPPNPVKPVIDALQEELQTIVLGFHVALGGVRNTIPELFSIHGTIPIPDPDEGAGVGEDDTVRIQPIDPDVEETGPNEGFDASKVIIGKSKEQIEQALGDVPLVVQHEEL